MNVVVKRSAVKMWLMAMGGIPLLIISLDVLTNRRITNWLRELIFNPEDTQIYEPRDVIFAWAMLLFAAFLVLWGLKELFVPTRIVECKPEGLALKMRGPFRAASLVDWNDIDDVYPGEVRDEGTKVPVLVVKVLNSRSLPADPWGARWLDDNKVGIMAEDWSQSPRVVADKIIDCAVEFARLEAEAQANRLSAALEEE
jgi:hypothetical protein